jgi:hypothetical protein
MKKLTATIISLALIFIFASSSYSLIHVNSGIYPKASALTILYTVNVNMNTEKELCGNYLVMITDGDGNQVVKGTPYIEGVTTYQLTEASYGFVGVREAHLIAVPNLDPVCDEQLNTEPAAMFTKFMPGTNYLFELYPRFGAQHE